MSRITLVVLLVALSSSVYCLDEESAKETKCFDIKKTVPVDMKWLASLKTIYYPVMSRLDLYRMSQHFISRDFKDITEDDLYYDACLKFGLSSDGAFRATGFNGISGKLSVRPELPGLEKYQFGDEGGFTGTCYTTMTDNKSFFFNACCSNGNEMHWGVASSEKTLSKKTIKMIRDHAESLGFSRKQFTTLRYDSCHKKDSKNKL